ncbi:hypothetical protein INR49_030252 [Caranx melampygus]|nr:hypothetical protein INR49_030252 [Caranx melampygus]
MEATYREKEATHLVKMNSQASEQYFTEPSAPACVVKVRRGNTLHCQRSLWVVVFHQ